MKTEQIKTEAEKIAVRIAEDYPNDCQRIIEQHMNALNAELFQAMSGGCQTAAKFIEAKASPMLEVDELIEMTIPATIAEFAKREWERTVEAMMPPDYNSLAGDAVMLDDIDDNDPNDYDQMFPSKHDEPGQRVY